MFIETDPPPDRDDGLSRAFSDQVGTGPHPHPSQRPEAMSGSGCPKFRNDRGVPEIRIGVREFKTNWSPSRGR